MDLHWGINPRSWPTPRDPEHMWERLVPVVLGGQEVLTFSPEDTLMTLCVHGTKHLWFKLQWLCDVARLLGTYGGIDWERVIAQAQALGSVRMLSLGLRLARDLLGVALPEKVWRRVQEDQVVPWLAARVRTLLFRDMQASPGTWQSTWFSLRAMDTLGRRCRFLYDTLLAPTPLEWALMPLPAALFPLYYVLRPFRLSGKYILLPPKRFLGP